MFTDNVGIDQPLGVMGDEAWGHVLRWHNDALGELVTSHHGEVLRTTGDGLFAAFDDPADALACGWRSSAHSKSIAAPRASLPGPDRGSRRQGHGRRVHEAARGGARPGGEVLAIHETVALAGDVLAAETPRTVALKGLAEPVEVVSIRWR